MDMLTALMLEQEAERRSSALPADDEQRSQALHRLVVSAQCGNVEAKQKLAELRQAAPVLYEALAEIADRHERPAFAEGPGLLCSEARADAAGGPAPALSATKQIALIALEPGDMPNT